MVSKAHKARPVGGSSQEVPQGPEPGMRAVVPLREVRRECARREAWWVDSVS